MPAAAAAFCACIVIQSGAIGWGGGGGGSGGRGVARCSGYGVRCCCCLFLRRDSLWCSRRFSFLYSLGILFPGWVVFEQEVIIVIVVVLESRLSAESVSESTPSGSAGEVGALSLKGGGGGGGGAVCISDKNESF